MKICPECKTENKFDGAQFCKKCGATLANRNDSDIGNNSDMENELEFEVTETAESNTPQLFGGSSAKNKPDDEELLEISDNANLLGNDEVEVTSDSKKPTDKLQLNNIEPKKPHADKLPKPEDIKKPEAFKVDWGSKSEKKKDVSPQSKNNSSPVNKTPSAGEFSKSRSEIKADKNVKSRPNNPRALSKKITHLNDSKPNQPQTADSNITKSSRVRGIAYFHKNIIQLAGNPFLHENDEIIYNGKPYRLRPYRIGKKPKYIGIAAVFILLSIIIGSQLIGPTLPGMGHIVGIILDENGQPYLGGAGVYISQLDKSVTSNALGFFRFDDVPTGSYELIYRLGDNLEGKENITVTSGSISMSSFGEYESIEEVYEYSYNQEIVELKPEPSFTEPAKITTGKSKKKTTSKKKSTSGYGKIKLVANIDGAKFVVDGKTLGAGNNTFSKIKSGKRKVTVSKPGYTEYSEIVTVTKNKTKTIKANLSRKASSSDETLTANDYFSIGNDAFVAENYGSAISEFSKAIGLSPNHVDAYSKRAQSYAATGKNDLAASDYIRIGEIYSFKNQNGLAISQFSSALKYSANNTTALVGRAGARMNKGEYRSALFDYTRAIEIDKRFYPAQLGAGVAEFKLGDNKSAEKLFKKAKKLNDSDPKLYHYLMLNYLARDNIKQMKKAYSQFKTIAGSDELAEFKSSTRFAPVVRLLGDKEL